MTFKPRFKLPSVGKAALMLQWLTYRDKPIYRDINNYPTYLYYDYGIDDPQSVFYELYSKGYLVKSPLVVSLSYYTIAELLKICDQLNITLKGKKAVIVNHLISHGDHEQIELLLPHGPCFCLTSKGREVILEGRKYVPEDHQHLFEIGKEKVEMRLDS